MEGLYASNRLVANAPVVLSVPQVAAALLYISCLTFWVYASYVERMKRLGDALKGVEEDDVERQLAVGTEVATKQHLSLADKAAGAHTSLWRLLRLDRNALIAHRQMLQAGVEFGTIMMWFYVADRTTVFPNNKKAYSRDLLGFLFLILTLVAGVSSMKPARTSLLLNRGQTEEWKGWMQVLFLLYHYFEAKEVYNAIRVFIAAYVWMTGYNNFSYYYRTKDFNVTRFCSMMWRLNFLVAATCLVLRNSYMLYYICPMHTLFTIMVYALLGIGQRYNQYRWGILLKLGISVAVVFVCWDIKPVFYAIWGSPIFRWLMAYNDPRRPSDDTLHEWYFRSSLDRYVWIHGMACALLHPWAEARLQRIESLSRARRWMIRAGLATAALAMVFIWGKSIYLLPKAQYNAVHPYTSWIPITAYIILRNLTPGLRLHSLALYGWLGRITLETYIGQFHTWLATGIPDGQPKLLLAFFPAQYPLLNFAGTTAVYIYVSYRLFMLTDMLRKVVIPDKASGRALVLNALTAGALGAALCAVAAVAVQWMPFMPQLWPAGLAETVGIHFHPR